MNLQTVMTALSYINELVLNTSNTLLCRDITGRLTMQTGLGLPEDPII